MMAEPPFRKVLVANRGEIAVRVMQTCREMGINTVAVYSEADRRALHVQRADEAYCIGPAAPLESYLSIERVIEAVRESGAEAVHPGYGFLAENAEFARAVEDAGAVWIGPSPAVITMLGDKIESKRLAEQAGVPVVPGYFGADQSLEHLAAEAERLGYPVMIKAAAGGGGRGMRAVREAADLAEAVAGARREAASAFGDDRVFLEKLVLRPRHIEIQLLVDTRGNAVYLGERECSIQRRHQKVLEESPSPVLTAELRARMGEAALRLARAAGYTNAGTAEFLFAGDRYYFLEVNTRIQVEHPVTEMVTGLDLIRLQLEVAAGKPLPFSQLDVERNGHAIEARLYAENPDAGFLPATGTLEVFDPPAGAGIRNDIGVYPGAEVTPYYDPILAKLIVHAHDRLAAVSRLREALARYAVMGVTTNLEFLAWVSEQEEFVQGRMDIEWLDRNWPPAAPELPFEVVAAAAIFDAAGRAGEGNSRTPWSQASGWRAAGAPRTSQYRWKGEAVRVAVGKQEGSFWHVVLDGQSRTFQAETADAHTLLLLRGNEVERFLCERSADRVTVLHGGRTYRLDRGRPASATSAKLGQAAEASLTAPMPGTVVKVAVKPGQSVAAHEPLVVLEAMKMEHVITAPQGGVVEAVLFNEGDLVPAGSPVVRLAQS